ncbi:translation initiation factor IF-2 subunit beta [Candidatus Pacearchaeota archaeon]|nr:translation initiation factor IF-2 subunit beta [Candidatus Pacearchaeota archaeon]MBD3282776.1 translation initiation factor IF-2 subunit beta [Candidatus Pacearchaeota archaeon]
MENYEKLLEKAYQDIKPIESNNRFEVPKIEGRYEGTKTILTNITQIASYLRRDPHHLSKFLLKELATSGTFKNNRVILQRKISSHKINEKIKDYVKEFVICSQCGKPDTELIKEKEFTFVHCLACGAKHSVRAKI